MTYRDLEDVTTCLRGLDRRAGRSAAIYGARHLNGRPEAGPVHFEGLFSTDATRPGASPRNLPAGRSPFAREAFV
ncbi:hypothetical protein CR492_07450 [Methylocella silvestris]|uniref:Uncharacterized protein n=1 Tax=Methylocella silvestris TaxID=199596 RepID=A0A2J7TIC0_METSI|nr:hypothetical protein CR492_07450 [Methylocella silvestris]